MVRGATTHSDGIPAAVRILHSSGRFEASKLTENYKSLQTALVGSQAWVGRPDRVRNGGHRGVLTTNTDRFGGLTLALSRQVDDWRGTTHQRRDRAMKFTSFVLAVVIASSLGPENIVRRIDLGEAVMVLPAGYRPQGGRTDVILHMHGAGSVVEKALVESGWQGPLLLFNRKGLSSVYSEPFRDPALFPRLLEKAQKAIATAWPNEDPKIGRVFVSSFSAGFGGIRELLAVPEHLRGSTA